MDERGDGNHSDDPLHQSAIAALDRCLSVINMLINVQSDPEFRRLRQSSEFAAALKDWQ